MSRPERPEGLSLVELSRHSKDSKDSKFGSREDVEDPESVYSPYFPHGESSYSLNKHSDAYGFDTPSSTAVEGENNPVRALPVLLPPLRQNQTHATSRRRLLVPIVVLWSSALLPALMGALFYASLGLKAPHGVFYANGTYVRPLHEGIRFGDEESFLTTHFSPLLLSSISSSLIGILSPAVMGLVGYHLALHWLRDSARPQTPHPTPMQYYHTLDLISNASPMAYLRLMLYVTQRWWARGRSARRRHLGLSKMLLVAGGTMCAVLTLDVAIRVIDVVLHSQIVSTIMVTPSNEPVVFPADVAFKPGCEDPIANVCGVANRTSEANLGGLNQSAVFRVYEHGSDVLDREDSMAFIGPVDPPSNLVLEADTLVASTHCDVYHPQCFVQDESPRACGPVLGSNMSATPELGDWNRLPWGKGFNTTTWQMRLQAYITVKGNLTSPGGKPPYSLSSGSNLNPFTTASFGCFSNYGGITYSDTNMSYPTPFINWWTYGAGIPNKPWILCSVSLCNTTVYDAKYNLSNGTVTLNTTTLTPANATAAVAVSGAGLYLGTGDTLFYQWGPRFIDDQIQIDLSAAGNTHGNDSTRFSAAWAQAYSNRYLGWTAGMVELAERRAQTFDAQLAVSIPLVTAYVFTVLHFVYACAIFLLGASCLVVARGDGSYRADLAGAHQRLSDTSTLVRDLAGKSVSEQEGREAGVQRPGKNVVFEPNSREQVAVVDSDTLYADSEVSVGLRRRTDGRLGLSFQREL